MVMNESTRLNQHFRQRNRFIHNPGSVFTNNSKERFNSLPNDKVLDQSKLKGFADIKINVIQNQKFVLGRVENIVEKGENAGYQYFLLLPQCFRKATFSRSLKVVNFVLKISFLFHR